MVESYYCKSNKNGRPSESSPAHLLLVFTSQNSFRNYLENVVTLYNPAGRILLICWSHLYVRLELPGELAEHENFSAEHPD
eukprot:5459800-Amphidinium_carterae.1